MQNLLTLFLVIALSYSTTAQEGLKLGVHFTPGISMALNKEDANKGETLDLTTAFAYNTGFLIGYGITEIFSISTGIHYQQHKATFIHKRALLSTNLADPNWGKKAIRETSYIRVPLLLEICTDPNRSIGFFARLGPHFDFLATATYKDTRLDGFSQYNANKGIDLRQSITLYQKNEATNGILSLGRKGKIYNDFVPGITVELGTQIRINDFLKVTLLMHLEGSSTPEGEGATSLAHNLNRGDYLVSANSISNPNDAAQDQLKANEEETPFDAIFPNYLDSSDPFSTFRNPTWNIMMGLQIGIIYTYRP